MSNTIQFADNNERQDFFNNAIMTHERLVRSICGRILSNPDDVDDAVQDTMLSAWAKLDTLKDTNAAKAWLCTIARRSALDISARVAKNVSLSSGPDGGREMEELLVSTVPGPEEQLILRSQIEAAQLAFAMLPEHYRYLIYLRFALCVEPKEISRRLCLDDRARINACSKAKAALKNNMAKLQTQMI